MTRFERGAASKWLVAKTSGVLGERISRRGFIAKSTILGSAIAASGCGVAFQAGAPITFIHQCPKWALCRDGYTEFCCVITGGINACPPDSVPAGWWRADYSDFCGGTRYYIDCNSFGGGLCRCGDGCDSRKVYCARFRYGQCNSHIPDVGVIACRVVTCVPPYEMNIGCDPSGAVDNETAGHFANCPPEAPPAPPAPPPAPPPPPPTTTTSSTSTTSTSTTSTTSTTTPPSTTTSTT